MTSRWGRAKPPGAPLWKSCPPSREEFAGGKGRHFEHRGHHLDLVDPGFDELFCLGVGALGAGDRELERGDFVGILVTAEILVILGDVAAGGAGDHRGRGLFIGSDYFQAREGGIEDLGDAAAKIGFQGAEVIRDISEDLVGGGGVGGLVVSHEEGASVAFHEQSHRRERLAVPVTREGVDVVAIEKDGSVEVLRGEVMTEFFLPRTAERRIEFGRLAWHDGGSITLR